MSTNSLTGLSKKFFLILSPLVKMQIRNHAKLVQINCQIMKEMND